MAKGYIRLYRGLQDNWVWQDKPYSKGQAWVDLLLIANHSDYKQPYGDGVVECRRGDVNRSISNLAERWGWSRDRVRTFLKQLEADGMIKLQTATKPTGKPTALTVENYTKYQCSPQVNPQVTDRLPTGNPQVTDRLPTPNNKNINVINDSNDLKLSEEGKAKWAYLRAKAGRQ